MSRAALVALACLGGGGGVAACAYYNGMWNAEHLANEARKLERQDRVAEAQNDWAQAAVKAESVVARHPTSRWADAALVLEGEALARSGACAQAAGPLARAVDGVRDAALRERAQLAAARCALEASDAVGANRALAGVTESRDGGRRSQAALLAGQAAALRGDPAAAADWFRRSDAPAAGPARVRALLAAGRVREAVALTDTVARGPFRGEAWAALLDDLRRAAGPDSASATLDRMLARHGPPRGARARLLVADGDALLAAGRTSAAAARYAQVAALVPDSSAGQLARVRAIRVLAVEAESVADLVAVGDRLQRVLQGGAAGAAASEGRSLAAQIERLRQWDDLSEPARFQLAEAVRDSLGATRLAARLFLRFASEQPRALFAPKALVAAAALWPERRDSIRTVLDSSYAASPYTLALRGEPSPAFAAAEDSLARALGLTVSRPTVLLAGRVAPPVPGPRGPLLDGPFPAAGALMAAAPRGEPEARPRARPTRNAGQRPSAPQGERPVAPPDTL